MGKPSDIRQEDWEAAAAVLIGEGWKRSTDIRYPDEFIAMSDIGMVTLKMEPIARAIANARQQEHERCSKITKNQDGAVFVPARVLRSLEFGARTGQFSDDIHAACQEAAAILAALEEKT